MGNEKAYTISFAGDTSLGEWYLRKPGKEDLVDRLESNPLSFFEGVKPLVEKSDYFILNLETVLEDSPEQILEGKEYPNYDHPDRILKVLEDLGVSAVSLANNHTMDFGEKVLLKTLKRLKKAKINTFGAGKNIKEASAPLKISLKGKKGKKNVYVFNGMRAGKRYREYGFFAEDKKPGVNSLPQKGLSKEISALREKDPESIIIVCPHWQGLDYKWASEHSRIQKRCRAFVDAGANYVFAHGTHMLNDIEQYHGGTIAYSIGNFVFNSSGRYKTMQAPPYSFVINMELKEKADGEWVVNNKLYPIITDNKKTNFNVHYLQEKEIIDFKKQFPMSKIRKTKEGIAYLKVTDFSNKGNSQLSKPMLELLDINSTTEIKQIKDQKSFNQTVDTLLELRRLLDEKYKLIYEGLDRSEYLNNHKKQALVKMNSVIDKNYVSHRFLKKYERTKTDIDNIFSFREIVVEKSKLRKMGYQEYSWCLDNKIDAYKFADRVGFRRPKTDSKVYKLEELPNLTPPIVIKPVRSTGSLGVYLVFNDNKILSVREAKYLNSWDELLNDATEKLKKNIIRADKWFIEELILENKDSEIATTNLKFHVFYGKVLFVQEESPEHWHKYCFWDENMNLVQLGKYEDKFYMGNGFNKKDLESIQSLSLKIPSPFARIDTLIGTDGLVLGEITPRVGQFHTFNDEWDKKLGEAYVDAEARIKKDLLKGKKFEEFFDIFEV
ncbi:CapA family protein [Amphibacillus sp. MSJ-3]|uniref:CapA family protein n=1 Tax=Amphibacillus sp. MSJ-3 TaxID=2841505 RepID=UPI001C0EEEA2|nr:CapA family protein [Amphibacillus sp. MSJ-3]MBU5594378.1 CapA family protein [Amphibacillus sp. MSJ-3]